MLVFWGGNWICFAAHGSHLFRVQKHEFIVHVPLAALVNWPGNKFTRISTIPGSISEVENGGGPATFNDTHFLSPEKEKKKKNSLHPKKSGRKQLHQKIIPFPLFPIPTHPFPNPPFPEPWPCGHWQSQTYTKLPPGNRKGEKPTV